MYKNTLHKNDHCVPVFVTNRIVSIAFFFLSFHSFIFLFFIFIFYFFFFFCCGDTGSYLLYVKTERRDSGRTRNCQCVAQTSVETGCSACSVNMATTSYPLEKVTKVSEGVTAACKNITQFPY